MTEEEGIQVMQELKAIREKKGLTQRDMSQRSGLSQGGISTIERKSALHVNVNTLERYAAAMGCSISITVNENETTGDTE